jgi:hypothetical protein
MPNSIFDECGKKYCILWGSVDAKILVVLHLCLIAIKESTGIYREKPGQFPAGALLSYSSVFLSSVTYPEIWRCGRFALEMHIPRTHIHISRRRRCISKLWDM